MELELKPFLVCRGVERLGIGVQPGDGVEAARVVALVASPPELPQPSEQCPVRAQRDV